MLDETVDGIPKRSCFEGSEPPFNVYQRGFAYLSDLYGKSQSMTLVRGKGVCLGALQNDKSVSDWQWCNSGEGNGYGRITTRIPRRQLSAKSVRKISISGGR